MLGCLWNLGLGVLAGGKIMEDVCMGIFFWINEGIVHRDLK